MEFAYKKYIPYYNDLTRNEGDSAVKTAVIVVVLAVVALGFYVFLTKFIGKD